METPPPFNPQTPPAFNPQPPINQQTPPPFQPRQQISDVVDPLFLKSVDVIAGAFIENELKKNSIDVKKDSLAHIEKKNLLQQLFRLQ